jgi:signal transduction histidine kinase
MKTVGTIARLNHTDAAVAENIMNSTPAHTSDLHSPLPKWQFRSFLLIFHSVFIGALALTLYAHWRRAAANHEPVGTALVCLVTAQALAYAGVFVFINAASRHPAAQRQMAANSQRAVRWWLAFIAVNVAIALAECRIDRAFEWTLVTYVGLVSGLRLGVSIPTTAAILVAWLLNRFGWTALASWTPKDWFFLLFPAMAFAAMILFMGRSVATSGERGQIILELAAAKRALEAARERELELAALRERERLARDLHDTLGHALVTMTVQLEAAQRLQPVDPARVTMLLAELQKLTRSSMEDLRRSLANLRTRGLGDGPLAESVKMLCSEAGKRLGISIDCSISAGADALPPAVAEVLWRTAQEGLTNIEKHAQAQRVEVNLTLQPKEVLMRVTDDGIGLPSGAEGKPGHYGLRGLRERVEGLGGTFTAAGAARGTVLEARVPVIA